MLDFGLETEIRISSGADSPECAKRAQNKSANAHLSWGNLCTPLPQILGMPWVWVRVIFECAMGRVYQTGL